MQSIVELVRDPLMACYSYRIAYIHRQMAPHEHARKASSFEQEC